MMTKAFVNFALATIFVCSLGFGQTINYDSSFVYYDILSYSAPYSGSILSGIFNYCINGTNNSGSQTGGNYYSLSSYITSIINETTNLESCSASHLLLRFDTSSITSSTISSAKIRFYSNNWNYSGECSYNGTCIPYMAFYYFGTSPGNDPNWVTYPKFSLCSVPFSQAPANGYFECNIPQNLFNQIKANPLYIDAVVFLSLPTYSNINYSGYTVIGGPLVAQLVVTTGGGAKLIIISESS